MYCLRLALFDRLRYEMQFNVGLTMHTTVAQFDQLLADYGGVIASVYFSLPLGPHFQTRRNIERQFHSKKTVTLFWELLECIKAHGIKLETLFNAYHLTDEDIQRAAEELDRHGVEVDHVALLDEYYGDGTSVAGISVNSELNGNVVVLRAAVKVGKGGKYRIGAWLLESGIYGKQTSAPDESYNIHDNCIRLIDAESHYMGHDLGMIASGSSAERVFTLKIDSGWKTGNCKVLLYVTSASGVNQVINNAVIVPIGEAVAYEY